MRTINFNHCTVLVFPAAQTLVTKFEDGAELPAAPNYDEASRKRARDLGYGDDLWAMTFDHEICHTVLAEMDGLPYSPALWAAAHPDLPRDHDANNIEEDRVFHLQKFLRYYLQYTGPHFKLPGNPR